MAYPLTKKIADLELLAPEYYSDDLPYHNYGHIIDTLATFDDTCRVLYAHNVSIDRSVGRAALLMHDANYKENYHALGYQRHEDYAADLSDTVLNVLGVRATDTGLVRDCIIATAPGEVPKTNTQKAVRYADIGNVYGPSYVDFVKNFVLLQRESLQLGRPLADSFEEQRDVALEFLSRFIVPMTFRSDSGEVVTLPDDLNFAERNIQRLSQATLQTVVSHVPIAERLLPKKWFSN